MPDFIIVGAAKAATTSLHHYLQQHPEIVMSRDRWTRYFHVEAGLPNFDAMAKKFGMANKDESERRYRMMCHAGIPHTFEAYLAQWPVDIVGVKLGESSPTYMYQRRALDRIHARFPEVKIVVVLRQPVDRAYSHFLMDLKRGWIKDRSFQEAISMEPTSVPYFWWGMRQYFRQSIYSPRLRYMLDVFGRDQVKVLRYDDLVHDPDGYFRELFQFLGVDSSFTIDSSVRHNEAGSPGNMPEDVPPLAPEFRSFLLGKYQPDIEGVQQLLGWDLSEWST